MTALQPKIAKPVVRSTFEFEKVPTTKEVTIPKKTEAPLKELLNIVATKKERMTLVYQKNVFLVAVPMEEVDLVEQLEECVDKADIEDAHKEEGSVSLDDLEKRLGL